MPRTRRPRYLVALALAVLVLVSGAATAFAAEAGAVTTVYVVRHAEKAADGGADPELTAEGEARARELAHVLVEAGIDAVYSTPLRRTQGTAAPVAEAAGVEVRPYRDAAALAAAIRAEHAGEQVLVVGHSNTLDDVAAALGVAGLADLEDTQYDRLYVIHLDAAGSHLERLRFGAATP